MNFCFGVCSDRDMVKCAQSGFDEFVSKPLTLDKLVDRLKKMNSDSAANYGLNP
jgi:DNA-binding response OmpR family regulator